MTSQPAKAALWGLGIALFCAIASVIIEASFVGTITVSYKLFCAAPVIAILGALFEGLGAILDARN